MNRLLEDFKPLTKNSNFVHLWNSQILSQITINIMNFLLLLRIFQNTKSAIATSLLWVAYALPAIFIGPFAAASVDMLNRKKILIVTNLLQASVIFVYSFSHDISLFLLYGVALLYSFLNQFYVPAELASLPSLVKEKNYAQANGLFFMTQQGAIIFGFGIAGVLLRVMGFTNALYLCSFMLFMAFISVTFLPDMKEKQEIPKGFESAVATFFKRIIEGYKFMKGNKGILATFALLVGLQVILAIIVVNVPVISEQIFNISVDWAGAVIVVPAGVGAVMGALVVPRLLRVGKRKIVIVQDFFALMALSMLVITLIIPELPLIYKLLGGILSIIAMGFSFVGILVPSQTFLQESTPGGYRGRVFGNFWFIVTIATIFPVIFSGTIAEVFGVRTLMFIITMAVIISFFSIKKFSAGFYSNFYAKHQ